MKKPHLSPSSIETYNQCPEKWRRRYECRDKTLPSLAAHRGAAIHKVAELNFMQKVAHKKGDLPAEEIVDNAVNTFDIICKNEGFVLTAKQKDEGKEETVGKFRDEVALLAQTCAEDVFPKIEPAAVEQEIRIVMDDCPRDLLGYLDLITVGETIDDFKTSSVKKWSREAMTHTQFIMYSLMFKAKYGREAKGVVVHELVPTKDPSKRYTRIYVKFGKADYEPLVRRINAVLKGIAGGFFPPTTPGTWWCSSDWCGYWETCPYVNPARKAAAAAPAKKKTARGVLDTETGLAAFMKAVGD